MVIPEIDDNIRRRPCHGVLSGRAPWRIAGDIHQAGFETFVVKATSLRVHYGNAIHPKAYTGNIRFEQRSRPMSCSSLVGTADDPNLGPPIEAEPPAQMEPDSGM